MEANFLKTDTLQLEHIETLLDVVFGVIIALALTKFPELTLNIFINPTQSEFCTFFILLSSLLFCVFYWLETRHFIAEQHLFNLAIGKGKNNLNTEVSLPLATFLLGSLLMMTIATAILSFSSESKFRAYLYANLLFWICDLAGTLSLKRIYRPYRHAIEQVRINRGNQHGWFLGHIISIFFIVYGIGNISFYSTLVIIDNLYRGDLTYRLWVTTLLLLFVLCRHLIWRSWLYSWCLKKKILKMENLDS